MRSSDGRDDFGPTFFTWLKDRLTSFLGAWLPLAASCALALFVAVPASGHDAPPDPAYPSGKLLVEPGNAIDPVVSEESYYEDSYPVIYEDAETGKKFYIHGRGHVPFSDPAEYPRTPALDCDNPNSIFYTWRPNLLGIDVPDEWDFYNLINTDRPDFTDATYTVGAGVSLLESGYTFRSATDHATREKQTKRSLPEVLLRLGVTDELELRVRWNGYLASDLHDRNTGLNTQLFGGDDMIVGFKYEVWQQQGIRPMLTFLSGTTVPTGTNGISSNQTQPFANWVFGWGIRRWLYLKASTGIDWQKTSVSTLIGGGSEPVGPVVTQLRDNINVYHGSASLLFQINRTTGGFVEYFGLAQTGGDDNRPANFVDTGLFYYLTPHVQLDVRIGQRLGERVNEVFTGAGFSTRW